MSAVKHSSRSRAAARALFPAAPEATIAGKHGRDGNAPPVAGLNRGERLHYRATPFYLKIEGLEGPRPDRYVKGR